ncbi:DUF3667 domain-containing protein [Flavobacterium sp. SM15]|uniref:DUF3667 domain-containing protein n=1 Tax=Flavobacterium sp. SM15 TaxID=2908005 RepID=UPI001EDB1A97|nr:DUF3667 domain-containing protein [Flavobacterium sp. SM15]MCG2612139.1 DUF3667 domain-containing protein [Flavobacterium sp. SM15]
MSKNTLRTDKTCLNCGTTVEERYCPQCGQENTETRKSFHYLFTHFLEDLIHYDSGFWKTMKYLLLYPAKLTREYLSGRRQSYVVPVKLYIFISFITFFLSGFVLNTDDIVGENKDSLIKVNRQTDNRNIKLYRTKDTIPVNGLNLTSDKKGWLTDYKTVWELDSIQKTLPENKRLTKIQYWFTKKLVSISEHNTPRETLAKGAILFKQNLPKVLFLYMPIFAFWLWLFHGKKRWYYFDHGIFTLHYFSFLLLLTSLLIIVEWILSYFDFIVFDILKGIIRTVYFFWPILYFYKAHKRLYAESKFVSFLKSSILFFINFVLVFFFLLFYIAVTFISIH